MTASLLCETARRARVACPSAGKMPPPAAPPDCTPVYAASQHASAPGSLDRCRLSRAPNPLAKRLQSDNVPGRAPVPGDCDISVHRRLLWRAVGAGRRRVRSQTRNDRGGGIESSVRPPRPGAVHRLHTVRPVGVESVVRTGRRVADRWHHRRRNLEERADWQHALHMCAQGCSGRGKACS